MSKIIETTMPPQRDSLQTHVSVSRSPRHSALVAIFAMLMTVLLFNIAAHTVTSIATSLKSNFALSNSTKLPISDCECRCPEQQQDWLPPAPVAVKLCFIANVLLGLTSCALLVVAFGWWMASAAEISASVRNYAMGCGIGAGLVGLVLVHILFMKKFMNNGGLLMAINTIMGMALAGLVFGTLG